MGLILIAAVAAGMAGSFYFGHMWASDAAESKVRIAEYKAKIANQQGGKLSKKIHKQRLMIRKLKAQLPPAEKKPRPSAQPTVVSH